MYLRSQTWLENGPARQSPNGARMLMVPSVVVSKGGYRRRINPRGVGADAPAASWGTSLGIPVTGIAPGSPCYDPNFLPGLTHGANLIQAMFCGASCSLSVSQAEVDCMSTGKAPTPLVTVNPPTVPVVDPVTGLLTPGSQTNTVNTGCPDGTTDCYSGGPGGCSFFCGLPYSSVLSSDCAACPDTTVGKLIVYGGLGLLGFVLFKSLARGVL
jgi:hypothetical protein